MSRPLVLATQYIDSPCGLQAEGLCWYQGTNETLQDSIVITEKLFYIIQQKDSLFQLSKQCVCKGAQSQGNETGTFPLSKQGILKNALCVSGKPSPSTWQTTVPHNPSEIWTTPQKGRNVEKKQIWEKKGLIPSLLWGLLSNPYPHVKYPLINFVLITECRKTRSLLIHAVLIYA